MMVVLVDKLLKTQIVECAAVANWIFSKDMMGDFTKSYVWEILHLTIRFLSTSFCECCGVLFNPDHYVISNFKADVDGPFSGYW
jgi:nuclear cap-binding protein subunit 1